MIPLNRQVTIPHTWTFDHGSFENDMRPVSDSWGAPKPTQSDLSTFKLGQCQCSFVHAQITGRNDDSKMGDHQVPRAWHFL